MAVLEYANDSGGESLISEPGMGASNLAQRLSEKSHVV